VLSGAGTAPLMIDFPRDTRILRTAIATANGRVVTDDHGNEGWPGIVSRFQLVLLAGLRSKQLFQGARPRIPADPLKRRNTSIALEELRRGLVPFRGQNGNESQTISTAIDTVGNTTAVEHARDLGLLKAE